jgi:tetratricopeptide (TPR) repeat protein
MEELFEEGKNYLDSEIEEKLVFCKQAVKESPEDFRGYVDMARCYGRLKRFDQAAEYAEKAIELNPEALRAYYVLTYVALSRKEKEKGLSYAQKVYELDPDSYYSLAYLGSAHTMIGSHEKAAELFEKALIINPDATDMRQSLIGSYLQLKKWREARDELEVVIKIDASPRTLYFLLGSIFHIKYSLLKYQYFLVWIAFAAIYFGAMIFEIMVLDIVLLLIFALITGYIIWTRKRNKAIASISAIFFVMGLLWLMIIVLRPYP